MGSILDTISEEQLNKAVKDSYNLTSAMKAIGYVQPRANNYKAFKRKCSDFNIDISHLEQNESNPLSSQRYTDEEIFIENSLISQSTLRAHFLKGEYQKYKCAICGISEWNHKPLTLRLDHINGNRTDDRLENLRWVCPNCDSQLDTYCNKGKSVYYCIDCGKVISSSKAVRCEECAKKAIRKVERPDRETLKELIRNIPFTQIANQYQVSDNAIRKWCDQYQLPRRKNDINKLTDSQWQEI